MSEVVKRLRESLERTCEGVPECAEPVDGDLVDALPALLNVVEAVQRLYSVTDGFDPRWIRVTDAEGASAQLERVREALARLEASDD